MRPSRGLLRDANAGARQLQTRRRPGGRARSRNASTDGRGPDSMFKRRKTHLRPDAASAARGALGILALLVLLLNVGGWVMLLSLARTQERLLDNSIQTSVALIAQTIPQANLWVLGTSVDPATKTTERDTIAYVHFNEAWILEDRE